MEHHINEWFAGQTVMLDSGYFEGCTFNNCRLVYRGGIPPEFSSNTFAHCEWALTDAADRTIQFLRTLKASGADEIVKEIIAGILDGPELPDAPPSTPN